jgi:hypothetical protein
MISVVDALPQAFHPASMLRRASGSHFPASEHGPGSARQLIRRKLEECGELAPFYRRKTFTLYDWQDVVRGINAFAWMATSSGVARLGFRNRYTGRRPE